LEDAALQMIAKEPAQVDRYFPLLNNWKAAVVQARPETIPPLTPQIPPP
jgi:hypothetical protein